MKTFFKNFFQNNWKFKFVHFGIMCIVLLIALTSFIDGEYQLQLPGNNIFANITFITVILMGVIYYFIFVIFEKYNIKPEKLYLVLVIPLAIMYCIANPLGKIPDEDQHARRAYMISKGIFLADKDESGKPVGMINSKIHELVTRTTTSYEEFWSRLTAPETDEEYMMNYSMATYSPICHIPQAFGMFIARLFGCGISVQCYFARVFNMILAITCIYFSIKLIPFKKHIVFFLGLLPITISEFASMSSDAITLGVCILFISYILYLKYNKNKKIISKKDIFILSVLSIVVSLCKIVYVPICLLLFTLPKEKFNKKNHVIIIKFGIFFGALIINILWLSYATTFLVEVNPGVNSKEQVIYILTHPISYLLILFRTIHIYNQTFILSLCGEGLGHFNSQASVLFVFPCLIIFAMLFFVNEDKNKKEFNFKEKIVYLIIFTIVVLLIYTSLYVAWTSLKSPVILGVQSRYFLPVILLTVITFDNKTIIFNKKIKEKYIYSFMLFMNLNALSCLIFMYINDYIINYYIK